MGAIDFVSVPEIISGLTSYLDDLKEMHEIKEEARNTARQKNKLGGPKEDKKGENK